jgi:hypothetical protein
VVLGKRSLFGGRKLAEPIYGSWGALTLLHRCSEIADLWMDTIYIMDSETEIDRRYADLVMIISRIKDTAKYLMV